MIIIIIEKWSKNGQKWSKNGRKWSKMVGNGRKWSKLSILIEYYQKIRIYSIMISHFRIESNRFDKEIDHYQIEPT